MFPPDVFGPLERFTQIVKQLGLPCVIGGSVASSIQGIPRQTIDLDVVVVLREDQITALVQATQIDFYVSETAVREAVKHHRAFNLIHAESAFKVDVYVSGDSEFDRAQFARSRKAELPGLEGAELRVASPEDIILRKLEWFRLGPGDSDRQWYDVLGVLKVQALNLDYAYLERWAAALGLADLLDRARHESDATGLS